MANERTIEVLLKLLEKLPADKLEILLKPENLLELLQFHGQDKESIRQALKGGKLPGEFLLELLEREPDADTLLAKLGANNRKPVKQPTVWFIRNTVRAKQQGSRADNYRLIAVLTMIVVSSILPAFILSGFLPNTVHLTNELATLIALIGGAIAGAISNPDKLFTWKGMVVGFVYSLGTLWAAIFYMQSRTSIFKFEILIPMIVGGMPALVVYFLLSGVSKAIAPK
jgi:hypothetical protein